MENKNVSKELRQVRKTTSKDSKIEYVIKAIQNLKHNSLALHIKTSNRGSMIIPLDDYKTFRNLIDSITDNDIKKLIKQVKQVKQVKQYNKTNVGGNDKIAITKQELNDIISNAISQALQK